MISDDLIKGFLKPETFEKLHNLTTEITMLPRQNADEVLAYFLETYYTKLDSKLGEPISEFVDADLELHLNEYRQGRRYSCKTNPEPALDVQPIHHLTRSMQ